MCGSCHFVRLLNIEIGVEYWMIFALFFNVHVKLIFGHLRQLEKAAWFQYKTCTAIHSYSLMHTKTKKQKKYSKFDANFNIWQPVEMTWSTHKCKVTYFRFFSLSIFKREKASARASSDWFCLSPPVIKSLIKSNYPKSIPTHSEPPNHTIPKEFLKNSQRIPKEIP